MIEFKNVTKLFGKEETVAVNDISFTIPDNGITVLVGPSGCGKTTTLRMINRLITPDRGDIFLKDESVQAMNPVNLRRKIGYVIQEVGLFPHMTIYENIVVVPRLLKTPEKEIKARVLELLDMVNLDPDDFLGRYPSQLSGGQRQRIGVIRALAADPDILLMDEPFGAVDPINREVLQDAFLEIQETLKKTIVMVTHDIREAVKMGDYISVMQKGSITQFGSVSEVVKNPANGFVEDLLGADRAYFSLQTFRVREIMNQNYISVSLDEEVNSEQIYETLKERRLTYVFIHDSKNRLKGYINRSTLVKGIPWSELLHPIESIKKTSTMREAMTQIIASGVASLPVTDDRGRLLGVIHFREALKRIEKENREESTEGEGVM